MPRKTTPRSQPEQQPKSRAAFMDERVRRSRQQVLTTTLELLTERGLGSVSIDEVSRRSGVAKTTIYRHWSTRSGLLIDACAQLDSHQEVANTGDVRADLSTQLHTLAHLLQTARWSSVLPSIMDAAERDPDLAAVHSGLQRGHAAPFREIIGRALETGSLPKATDPSALIAALVGPLYYRRWFSREPLDDAFVDGLIEMVLAQA